MPKKLDAESIEAADNFSNFLETEPMVEKLLSIGLSFGEILELYKEKTDSPDCSRYYNAFYRQVNNHNKKNGISGKNITKITQDIGGKRFRKVSNIVIYYNKNGSFATRLLFEMEDSKIVSYHMKMLDVIGELEQITEKNIADAMFEKYNFKGRGYDTKDWLSRFCKSGLMSQNNGSYLLGQPIVPYFSPENREIWEDLKDWTHRRKIFL